MLRNYWLEQQEAEDVAYFRSMLLKPLRMPRFTKEAEACYKKWKKTGLLDELESNLSPGEVLLEGQPLTYQI